MHVVHHEEELPLESHHIERLHDVRVPDAGRETCFVEEHRDELRVLGELGMQPLNCHGPREAYRPTQSPVVHRRHPTRGDFSVESVAPDDVRK